MGQSDIQQACILEVVTAALEGASNFQAMQKKYKLFRTCIGFLKHLICPKSHYSENVFV